MFLKFRVPVLVSIYSEYLLKALSPDPLGPLAAESAPDDPLDDPVASDSFRPGRARFAANPPGLGEVPGLELAGIVGEEAQFLVPGRATGGRRPGVAPANGPLTGGGEGPDEGLGGTPGEGLGTAPVDAAWGKLGGGAP